MSEHQRKARLQAAAKLAEKGQLDKAIEAYQALCDEDQADVRAQHKLAEVLARAGRQEDALSVLLTVAEHHTRQGFFARAVAVYKQALRLAPKDASVHTRLAELYLKMQLKAEAITNFTSAARLLQKEGRHDEALPMLERLVQINPDNVSTRLRHGDALLRVGHRAEGLASLRVAAKSLKSQSRLAEFVKVAERIIRLEPNDVEMVHSTAQAHLDQGNPRAALGRIQNVFKVDPRNTDTLAIMAEAFLGLNQDKKAARVMRERALVFEAKEDYAQARALFEGVLELNPGDAEALRGLRLNDEPIAASPFRAAPAPLEPVSVEATGMYKQQGATQANRLVAESESFAKLGLLSRARDCLIRAVQMRSADTSLRERLLNIYLSLEDKSGAVRQLIALIEAAKTQNDSAAEAQFRSRLEALGKSVGVTSVSQSGWDTEDLETLLDRAAAELGDDEIDVSMTIDPVHAVLADIDLAFNQGERAKADQMLSDALSLFPDNPELLIRQKRAEAVQRARGEGSRIPDLPIPLPEHYGEVVELINGGQAKKAVEALRDWVEKPIPGQAIAHFLTGIALHELNKISRGISFLKRALHGDDLPELLRLFVHYELAIGYQAMEDDEEAVYYLRRVLRKDPNFLDAQVRLDQLSDGSEAAQE